MSLGTVVDLEESNDPFVTGFSHTVDARALLTASILDHALFAVAIMGADLRCQQADERFAALLEIPAKDLVGRSLADFDHTVAHGVIEALAKAASTRKPVPVDCLATRLDGHRVILTGCVAPYNLNPGGRSPEEGYLIFVRDIADSGLVAGLLAGRDPFVTTLLDATAGSIVITDSTGTILTANRACCELFSYEASELLGQNISILMPQHSDVHNHSRFIQAHLKSNLPKPPWIRKDTFGQSRDGTIFPIHIGIGTVRIGDDFIFIAAIRDISDRLLAEQHASFLARHDPLTGVLTRTAFLDECEAVLFDALGKGDTACFVLYSLDIDHFSDFNEAFSFHIGDAVLKVLASRLLEVLPDQSRVCRIAADEFAVLAWVKDAQAAYSLADTLHSYLTMGGCIENHWVRLRVSIGAAILDPSIQGIRELTAKAKLAQQAVQQNKGNAVCFYTQEMAAVASRRMRLSIHLANVLERNELHLLYQPILDAKTNEVICAEALLRWTHQTLGSVSPAEFIPVAEETDLILSITDWVLAETVEQMVKWDEQGVLPDRVFLNISGQQFLRGNFPKQIAELLEKHPTLKNRLGLEITEQSVVRDLKSAVHLLNDLADIGVQVALDDFGSGYSSLSYVQQLPIAKLKIDSSFVVDVPKNTKNAALVRAAVGMAHGLGLPIVAEGVETQGQHDFLVSIGCDQLQGYLFSVPLEADAFADVVRARRKS